MIILRFNYNFVNFMFFFRVDSGSRPRNPAARPRRPELSGVLAKTHNSKQHPNNNRVVGVLARRLSGLDASRLHLLNEPSSQREFRAPRTQCLSPRALRRLRGVPRQPAARAPSSRGGHSRASRVPKARPLAPG